MRRYFTTETFPSLSELVNAFDYGNYSRHFCSFLNLYYDTLCKYSQLLGFELIRLSFEEMRCIVHRPNNDTLIIELTAKENGPPKKCI